MHYTLHLRSSVFVSACRFKVYIAQYGQLLCRVHYRVQACCCRGIIGSLWACLPQWVLYSLPSSCQTDLSAGTGPSHKNVCSFSFPVTPTHLHTSYQCQHCCDQEVKLTGLRGPSSGNNNEDFPKYNGVKPLSFPKVRKKNIFLQAKMATFHFLWFADTGIEIQKIGFVNKL